MRSYLLEALKFMCVCFLVITALADLKMLFFLKRRDGRIGRRILTLSWHAEYCKATKDESGKCGPWFHAWIIFLVMTAVTGLTFTFLGGVW